MNFLDDDAAGMWAQKNTGQDVAKNKRLMQPLHDKATEKCGDNQNDDVGGNAHEIRALKEKNPRDARVHVDRWLKST